MTLPDSVRDSIFLRDNFQCVQCGSPSELAVDRIVPQSVGGGDDAPNLQTLCKRCNSAKQARMAHIAIYGVSINVLRDYATLVISAAMGFEDPDKLPSGLPTSEHVAVAFRVLREVPGLGIGRDVKPMTFDENGISKKPVNG